MKRLAQKTPLPTRRRVGAAMAAFAAAAGAPPHGPQAPPQPPPIGADMVPPAWLALEAALRNAAPALQALADGGAGAESSAHAAVTRIASACRQARRRGLLTQKARNASTRFARRSR